MLGLISRIASIRGVDEVPRWLLLKPIASVNRDLMGSLEIAPVDALAIPKC